MEKPTNPIPFNKPFIVGKELYNIAQAVAGGHLAGDGVFTKQCHQWLEEALGTKKALLTHSCTAALEMSALLIGIEPGDEVLMPSYTFVSTANAFALRGAKIRFVDIRPDTLNMNEKLLEEHITPRTKCIVPVHYAGVPCEMDFIMDLARQHELFVIEDAAQSMLSRYKGQQSGCIGQLGSLSFHETKNYISGEGGALLINDENFIERAEVIREKGTNRSRFFRGEVDKYTWVDVGSSYLPSELVAAFLSEQLIASKQVTERRKQIYARYEKRLKPLEETGYVRLPVIPKDVAHNSHMFYLITGSFEERSKLISHLAAHDIKAVFHYVPLHLSPMGEMLGYRSGDFPITEDLSERLVRLPFYYDLSLEEQEYVITIIEQFYG
jgi:dTDP-4-amino-4,6-dideoxygalactose transaminase